MTKKNRFLKRKEKFHTGITSAIDRSIDAFGLLSISQIMGEKTKLKNLRNGKVRQQPI